MQLNEERNDGSMGRTEMVVPENVFLADPRDAKGQICLFSISFDWNGAGLDGQETASEQARLH